MLLWYAAVCMPVSGCVFGMSGRESGFVAHPKLVSSDTLRAQDRNGRKGMRRTAFEMKREEGNTRQLAKKEQSKS